MKNFTFLAAAIFAMASTANASEIINPFGHFSDKNTRMVFSENDPVEFTERGIQFFVFPNGEFDFNTVPETAPTTYYKNGRRNTNTTYGAPSGTRIEHDALGRIRRIGNVFINYDSSNRIKRIGTIYMNYNRFALIQVGNLKIFYNRNGQITSITGAVKNEIPVRTYHYNNGQTYGGQNDNIYYKTGNR